VSQGSAAAGEAVEWSGEVTWREVAGLREELFDRMDARPDGVSLDVRQVTVIDRTGLALLIGANHRARSIGRPLTLVAADGPVTSALSAGCVLPDFTIALVPGTAGSLVDGDPGQSGERPPARGPRRSTGTSTPCGRASTPRPRRSH